MLILLSSILFDQPCTICFPSGLGRSYCVVRTQRMLNQCLESLVQKFRVVQLLTLKKQDQIHFLLEKVQQITFFLLTLKCLHRRQSETVRKHRTVAKDTVFTSHPHSSGYRHPSKQLPFIHCLLATFLALIQCQFFSEHSSLSLLIPYFWSQCQDDTEFFTSLVMKQLEIHDRVPLNQPYGFGLVSTNVSDYLDEIHICYHTSQQRGCECLAGPAKCSYQFHSHLFSWGEVVGRAPRGLGSGFLVI